jgi:hypothetical protein
MLVFGGNGRFFYNSSSQAGLGRPLFDNERPVWALLFVRNAKNLQNCF